MNHDVTSSIARGLAARWDYLERWGRGRWTFLPIGGVGISELFGTLGQIDGTHVMNLIAVGLLGVGSSAIGLWRLYSIKKIQNHEDEERSRIRIAEEERLSFARVPGTIVVSPSASVAVAPAGRQVDPDVKPEAGS